MKNVTYKRIGHVIRWVLELLFLWFLVLPETGIWTSICLTLITVGIEWDHIVPGDWTKPRKGRLP